VLKYCRRFGDPYCSQLETSDYSALNYSPRNLWNVENRDKVKRFHIVGTWSTLKWILYEYDSRILAGLKCLRLEYRITSLQLIGKCFCRVKATYSRSLISVSCEGYMSPYVFMTWCLFKHIFPLAAAYTPPELPLAPRFMCANFVCIRSQKE
jgi:hypothetical protein